MPSLPRQSYHALLTRTCSSQAAFQKCITHHGAMKCVGRHPVTPASVDIDYDEEDSKMHPDCVMYYSPNAYADVRSCCPVSTVRALVPKKAETSEYQISKPPCGARSSPMPVSCGACGGGRGA